MRRVGGGVKGGDGTEGLRRGGGPGGARTAGMAGRWAVGVVIRPGVVRKRRVVRISAHRRAP
ncbi:hypothetical protein Srufu_033630 [Streptomyces libani subsp. rufus]|nr:hypothetical protein Srufu_033630 [Streptomyces libani subsp. rufus]